MKNILSIVLLLLLVSSIPAKAITLKEIAKKIYTSPQEVFENKVSEIHEKYIQQLINDYLAFWTLKDIELPLIGIDMTNIKVTTGAKNFPESMEQQKTAIEKSHQSFLANKNNMSNNKFIYDKLGNINNGYKVIKEALEDSFTETYKQYNKELQEIRIPYELPPYTCDSHGKCTVSSKFAQKLNVGIIESPQELYNEVVARRDIHYNEINNLIDGNIALIDKYRNEIENYSIQYETKKLNNFYKSYGKIQKCNTQFHDPIFTNITPQYGCYYDTYTPLKVMQVINGGVLAQNLYSMQLDSNVIYIMTRKNYVDGNTFTGRYLYKGTFKYTSLLGTRTVQKYQEIPIPDEKFYFLIGK